MDAWLWNTEFDYSWGSETDLFFFDICGWKVFFWPCVNLTTGIQQVVPFHWGNTPVALEVVEICLAETKETDEWEHQISFSVLGEDLCTLLKTFEA